MSQTEEQPAPPSPPPSPPSPPPRDECFRCGYDLRGIADDQPCPECGLLAARSRRFTDALHDTRPRWLRRLAAGVGVLVAAVVMAYAWPFVSASLDFLINVPTTWSPPPWVVTTFEADPMLGFEFAALLLIVGAMLLTGPEGYEPADRADLPRRLALRLAAAVPLAGLLLQHLVWGIGRLTPGAQRAFVVRNTSRWWVVVAALLTVGCAPLPILLFYQLRSLAKRARSAQLAEHCAIVGIGTSLALLYVGVATLLFQTAWRWSRDPYWTTRGNTSLVIVLLLGVAAGMFLLWSLYLLIRFAIAFHLASRQLGRKWSRDDRALVSDDAPRGVSQ